MELILANPLWIALLVVTIGVHVGFFVAVRRLMRKDAGDGKKE